MASYSVREAKNRLSALLARVRRGARIVITDRGVPVAVLVPPAEAGGQELARAARVDNLVRGGLVARRRKGPSEKLLAARPIPLSKGASAVAALLDERAGGR